MSDNPFAAPTVNDPPIVSTSASGYQFRTLRNLTRVISVAMGINVTCLAAMLVINAIGTLTYPTFHDFDADISSSNEQILLLALGVFGIVFGITFIVLVVATCMFMYRANANVRALGATALEYSPGWCGGYWFVPILNLFRPYQAMKEIYKASCKPNDTAWKGVQPLAVFGWWWGCWLIGNWLTRGSTRLEQYAAEMGGGLVALDFIASVLMIAAGVMLVVIVRAINNEQTLSVQPQVGR